MPELPASLDESARRRFEADWRTSTPADLAAYLPAREDRRWLATLVELVSIDMEMRWRKRALGGSKPLPVESYVAQFEPLGAAAILSDLAQQEAILRSRAGEAPSKQEYAERFPNLDPARFVSGMVNGQPFNRRPRIPDCEILRELGTGGMGVVYLADQPSLGRHVAVKTLRRIGEARPQDLMRFFQEAEAVGRLQNPNIVAIHHIGRDADLPYFLMEYVAGGTLADRLLAGPLPAVEAATLVETLARAMEYAHERGIIHRDLKPANILIDQSIGGRTMAPKISDFGLAKALDTDWRVTQTGAILGTPAYMAPEQASKKSNEISTRTDVYALGAILYETLTGRPPFEADSMAATLDAILNAEPVPPSRLRPGISRDLDTICMQCLQKDPARRYASAELLADDLRRSLRHQPIQARRIGPLGMSARWCRRNPAPAATLAIALAVIAIVAGVAIWNVLQEREKFRNERDRAEGSLYQALTAQASAQLDSRGSEWWWTATASLARAARIDTPERNLDELRDLYIRCLGTPYHSLRLLRTWPCAGKPVRAAISPDGNFAAVALADGAIELRDFQNNAFRSFAGPGQRPVGLVFHPKVRALYCCTDAGKVRCIAFDSTEVKESSQKLSTELTTLAIEPEGRQILLGTTRGPVRAIPLNAAGGFAGKAATLPGGSEFVSGLTFTSDGRNYVVADRSKTILGRDAIDGKEVWKQKTLNPVHALRYKADGTLLCFADPLDFGFSVMHSDHGPPITIQQIHDNSVRRVFPLHRATLTASHDGSLAVWGREAGQPMANWTRSQPNFGPITDADLCADETRVAVSYLDGTLRVWEVYEPTPRVFVATRTQSIAFVGNDEVFDGIKLTTLQKNQEIKPVHEPPVGSPQIWGVDASRDGRFLAAGDHDGRVQLWGRDRRERLAAFRESKQLVWCVAFHPGKPWLATGSEEIILWDCESLQRIGRLPGHQRMVTCVAFHPNLPLLASAGRDGFLRLWDLESQKLLAERELESIPNSLAFDADGRLAVGCDNSHVLIWSIKSPANANTLGAPERSLTGHTSPVRAVAFSGDGLLASGAEQGRVLLHDVRDDYRRLAALQSGTGQVRSLQFSHDNRKLACGHYISAAVVWDLPSLRTAMAEVNLDWHRQP